MGYLRLTYGRVVPDNQAVKKSTVVKEGNTIKELCDRFFLVHKETGHRLEYTAKGLSKFLRKQNLANYRQGTNQTMKQTLIGILDYYDLYGMTFFFTDKNTPAYRCVAKMAKAGVLCLIN